MSYRCATRSFFHPDQTAPPGLYDVLSVSIHGTNRGLHLRSVALEVVVDVDSDTWVGGLVVSRDSNLRRVSRSPAANVDLGTANIL